MGVRAGGSGAPEAVALPTGVYEEVVHGTLKQPFRRKECARCMQLRHAVHSAEMHGPVHVTIAELALAAIAHPCAFAPASAGNDRRLGLR